MNTDLANKKNGKAKIGDRYWSVMLVGEHGQVVPFRRFKSIALSMIGGLVVLLITVVVLAILLAIRTGKIDTLEADLKISQKQLAELRDEKDLLLTQMVIKKEQIDIAKPQAEQQIKAPATDQEPSAKFNTQPAEKPTQVTQPKPEQPKPPAEPVRLNADARGIKVSYQPERQLLSLAFRIYNTSSPKVPLSGRSVVVFKKQDDPPIQWMAVPRVQLIDGKPSGKRGKAFKINNFRTLNFKAFNQKTPIRYNLATIFIYASNGDLLTSRDHNFEIKVKPKPKLIVPEPKPKATEKMTTPLAVPPIPVQQPSAQPQVPSPAPDNSGTAADPDAPTVETPAASDAQTETETPATPSGQNAPETESQGMPDMNNDPDSTDSGSPDERIAPPAETSPNPSQPTIQGEPQ